MKRKKQIVKKNNKLKKYICDNCGIIVFKNELTKIIKETRTSSYRHFYCPLCYGFIDLSKIKETIYFY